MKKQTPSETTQNDALKIAKATQKPGQTKEQTKLISQGIEKGIAEYKKQQKLKAREVDKQKKKTLKQKNANTSQQLNNEHNQADTPLRNNRRIHLCYLSCLVLSWLGFYSYNSFIL